MHQHRSHLGWGGLAAVGLIALSSSLQLQAQTPFALPADWAYPVTAKPADAPGFAVRVHQAAATGTLATSSARAESQLAGLLIDPGTGQPYENKFDTNSYVFSPAGVFNELVVIDYEQSGASITGQSSSFGFIPGIPGVDGGTDNIAMDAVTWLELSPGVYTMVVNSDDGFRVYAGRNASDKATAVVLGEYEGGRGAGDTIFKFSVSQAGLYSFRLLYYEGGSGANVSWYAVAGDDNDSRILVNDPTSGVKAYRTVTATIPPYFSALSPLPNQTEVSASANVQALLVDGSAAQILPANVDVFFDGNEVAATVTKSGNTTTIAYDPPGLYLPLSVHNVRIVYVDSTSTTNTLNYSFTASATGNLTLPTPLFLETFDGIPEGTFPTGWSQTNFTPNPTGSEDLLDPRSDSYLGFVVISRDTVAAISWDVNRRLTTPELYVNGVQIPSLVDGQFAYAESDVRSGSQIQYLYSREYDLTGQSSIFLSYHSIYEQNQDNIAGAEYSIDGGATWLPVVYMIDRDDIIRNSEGGIDAVATLTTEYGDVAVYQDAVTGEDIGRSYGAFIGAPISQDLAPYISGRVNDDFTESKRVELFPLPQAANQSRVRVRFFQAGTASWYFGVDNVGLYSITQIDPPLITGQPASLEVVAGQSATFSVTATGVGLGYQWYFGTTALDGQTNAALNLTSVTSTLAGSYSAVVANSGGSVTSAPAILSVLPTLADNSVLNTNLLVYLPFDGNYTDASGNNRDAAAVGTPTFPAGKVGTGALGVVTDSANGIFNYATLANQIDFGTTTDFTVSFWVRKNSSSSDPALISNKDWDSGNNPGFVIFADSSANIRWNYRAPETARRDFSGPAGMNTATWRHITVVYDRDGNARTYADGALIGTTPIGPVGSNFQAEGAVLNIGQDGFGDYSPSLNAEFDEVAIWGRTLSVQEIYALYTAGQAGQSFLAVASTPTLSATTAPNGDLVITFTGTLQSATSLGGTFAPVAGAVSPYTVSPTTGPAALFFRASN